MLRGSEQTSKILGWRQLASSVIETVASSPFGVAGANDIDQLTDDEFGITRIEWSPTLGAMRCDGDGARSELRTIKVEFESNCHD
ncbi:hypothetical protein A8B73_21235 [Methylosinus sp. 3S-1]|nr:hypothetical protein A8B73_21235 [Methylosinus sp. 3S-1]